MNAVFQFLIDALSLGSIYACIALGIALIFGVMNLVNLAHGELIMVTGYTLLLTHGLPLPLRIIIAITAGVLAGILMDKLAFRFIRGAKPATLMIVSFGIAYLLQNLAILFIGSQARAVALPSWVSARISVGGIGVSPLDLVTVLVTVLLLAGMGLVLYRTPIGRQMRAASEDFTMARLVGVKSDRVISTAFALAGFLAAVAGILLIAKTGTVTPTMGLAPLLAGVVATVIGGSGNLKAAVYGAYLFGALTVAIQAALPTDLVAFRDAVAFALVILVLIVRPQGLFIRRAVAERV
ncbi:branched-chain amino acid ABC transporter permease [Ruicaihuangia caeni]|uniref:Branched-chain amino acid ABC transporter permease n=1 Tax=Ruicaihuangia caeni TaxID=3042517 RepID=A0AAW6T9P8_9MICO|nr:branched-chain amino acid ABC transporter permease [Klugiella sp. YN-L-19]MDI2099094.1 branched-chain amino acid ABC transporter permease [Klugiella sp. YN-L-19]